MRPFRRYVDSLKARLSAWKRWTLWTEDVAVDGDACRTRFAPTVLETGRFFIHVSRGGVTAASAMMSQMKWWARNLGLALNMESSLLEDFRHRDQGHELKQAEPLELEYATKIYEKAISDTGPLGIFAAMVILLLSACLRWRHAQRSHVTSMTSALVYGWCRQGKRREQGARPCFDWAAPRSWEAQSDVAGPLYEFYKVYWKDNEGDKEGRWLVPDVTMEKGYVITDQSEWLPWRMSYGRFIGAFRSLLRGLGMKEDEAVKRTYYAIRRELPTGADVLALGDDEAYAVGNWQEIPKGLGSKRPRAQPSMPKTYAACKVTTGGLAKAKVVAAIMHTRAAVGPCFDWEDVRAQRFSQDKLDAMAAALNVSGPSAASSGESGQDAAAVAATPGESGSSTETSEEEPVGEAPELEEGWFIQDVSRRRTLHFYHEEMGGAPIPLCTGFAFPEPPVSSGYDIEIALGLGHHICRLCLKKASA